MADDRNLAERPARTHIVWQTAAVTRVQHERQNGHRGMVVWLTGLPGSGKSSIAHAAQQQLHQLGFQTTVLDGDNIRHGLCADLGFSVAERNENVRRVGEVAKLLVEMGAVVFVALVSPIREARDRVRRLFAEGDFIEVYCHCPLPVCKQRDPKGLYLQAEEGRIAAFTGVSSPYEAPLSPALRLDTDHERVEESVQRLTQFLRDRQTGALSR